MTERTHAHTQPQNNVQSFELNGLGPMKNSLSRFIFSNSAPQQLKLNECVSLIGGYLWVSLPRLPITCDKTGAW